MKYMDDMTREDRIERSIFEEELQQARERSRYCREHDIPMQTVCGTETCGRCYADALLSEPYRPVRLLPLPDMTLVGGHRIVYQKRGN